VFETGEQVVADADAVGQSLQGKTVLLHSLHAEEAGLPPHSQDQVIVGYPAVRGGNNLMLKVNARHLGHLEAEILLPAKDAPHRLGDLFGIQVGRRYLIEQRLEEVVIVPVDQGDIHGSPAQHLRSLQPAETGPDNDNPRPAAGTHIITTTDAARFSYAFGS